MTPLLCHPEHSLRNPFLDEVEWTSYLKGGILPHSLCSLVRMTAGAMRLLRRTSSSARFCHVEDPSQKTFGMTNYMSVLSGSVHLFDKDEILTAPHYGASE